MKTVNSVVLAVIAQLVMSPFCQASSDNYNLGLSTADEHTNDARGNEYSSGLGSGAVLMRIDLWGAVQKTGVHHVPPRTNLVTLLSYAGGPLRDAETDSITIRREINGKPKNIEVNLSSIFATAGATAPVLEPNDIVVVPTIRPVVSNNTVLVATMLTTVLGVIVASFAISNQFKK